jgi:hypothetical protein
MSPFARHSHLTVLRIGTALDIVHTIGTYSHADILVEPIMTLGVILCPKKPLC